MGLVLRWNAPHFSVCPSPPTGFVAVRSNTYADSRVPAPGVVRRVRGQRIASGLAFARVVRVGRQRRLRATPAIRAGRHAALVDGRRLPLQPRQLVARHRHTASNATSSATAATTASATASATTTATAAAAVLAMPSLGWHMRLRVAAGPRRVNLQRNEFAKCQRAIEERCLLFCSHEVKKLNNLFGEITQRRPVRNHKCSVFVNVSNNARIDPSWLI